MGQSLIKSALAHHSSTQPNKIALQGEQTSFTYAQLEAELTKISAQLNGCKLRVLGIFMESSPAWAILDLAAIWASIPVVPLPLFFSAAQICHAISNAGIDIVMTDQPLYLEQLLSAQKINILNKQHYLISDRIVAQFTLQAIPATLLPPNTAKITYTSGTTGQPKGVCLSLQTIERVVLSLLQATEAKSSDCHLSILPLSTLLENLAGLYLPLVAGASILLPAKSVGFAGTTGVNAQNFIQAILNRQTSSIILTPELLNLLITALEEKYTKPRHLRFIAVGGASVSPQLLQRAEVLGLPVFEGYGLSECASVVALNTLHARKVGSVGKPLAHIEIRIAHDDEILIRGANLLAYAGEQPYTNRGFFPTGDIGYLDSAGFLHISGRKKNIFITSYGRNISPEWVERELILAAPIKQAALFGESKPWNTAVIFPTVGATKKGIQTAIDVVNKTLPSYARVVEWVYAARPFSLQNGQLTSNGRLRRDAIWQQYHSVINPLYRESKHVVL
ncbi:MAG: AMP-binding protein [Methylophilaceae bacterium]